MTDTAKTTLWVIIILVLVGGIWWFIGNDSTNTPPPAPVVQETNQIEEPVVQAEPEDASTTISVQDKTDDALAADLNKVDEQLKALSADSTN